MAIERYWPLGSGHVVTSGFGDRSGGFHWGTDFGRDGGSAGMPVYAAQAGTVTYAGPASGFGQWVVIDHPTEAGSGTTVYGHVIPEVRVGQEVEAGQRIARINGDQRTNGGVAAHLHFEVHRDIWRPPGPGRLDPLPWLATARDPATRDDETVVGLTPEVLAEAMGRTVALDRYRQLFPAVVESLLAAGCITVNRAAMWLAQVGHESAGLKYMREIASGSAYEGRRDLGNTVTGDGVRFAGRGPIQITGRHNYTRLSQWAHGRGLVPTPTFFVDHPEALESDRYGFMGVTWYWTAARDMNGFADRGDIEGATRAVNGGLNGLADRVTRWNRCRSLGAAILPIGDDMTPDQAKQLADVHRELTQLYPSRSAHAEDPKKLVDTLAGMLLNVDGRVHEVTIELPAKLDKLQQTLDELPARIAAAVAEVGGNPPRDVE